MRTVTATEKYIAVQEGTMAKREFIRQMRQQYPMYVSQYNGYDDTVQILKNKGMISEISLPPVYDERPAANVSLDVLDRAIRIELQNAGVDVPDGVNRGNYNKAKKKAEANLAKNVNYYIDKIAGESSKLDKHDKCTPVKRGAPEKDTFNGLKKATLKEAFEGKTYTIEQVKAIAHKVGMSDPKAKRAILSGVILYDPDTIPQNVILDILKRYDISPESVGLSTKLAEEDTDASGETLSYLEVAKIAHKAKQYVLDAGSAIMDQAIRWEDGEVPLEVIKKILHGYDMTLDSIGYHSGKGKFYRPSTKSVHVPKVSMNETSKVSGALAELKRRLQADSNAAYSEEVFKEYLKDLKENLRAGGNNRYRGWKTSDFLNDFETFVGRSGLREEDELNFQAAKVSGDKTGSKFTLEGQLLEQKRVQVEVLTEGKRNLLKESIKKIIVGVLTEQNLTEAATADLSSYAERHSNVEGLGEIVNSLENIVTEVESFYHKQNGKIQDIFDRVGELKDNEERSVGALIAPGLEESFMKDLRPVMHKFPGDYKIPQQEVAPNAGLDEFSEEEPKQTVFAPSSRHDK